MCGWVAAAMMTKVIAVAVCSWKTQGEKGGIIEKITHTVGASAEHRPSEVRQLIVSQPKLLLMV